ncbi:hypothetical protein PUNSTDRAFT_135118 [Punctularia strigosozonata HHB-11173 SS5]|uniref:uncharacterized protein n=1 Tax=Punctularia strigosozonata (strain HHB-11173) TaxID=741275 RepID=UPI0004417C00|nr:uncharacterized protein PUNSTDRAFT_135118 [Punctularia strigosozonata HHB-11173 SS5]EIN07596.1 hypothetical protein PUNSTDRAFT_135118 [Punctularia strigosozonata HHB-11173 SS5]
MGANQSQPDQEKVIYNDNPIHFSEEVVNQLANQMQSSSVPPERQATLDEQVRSRIQSELTRLREEEENIRRQIELALEKENLDRERNMAGGENDGSVDGSAGNVKSSAALMGDLNELQSKVDRFHAKRDLTAYPAVKESGDAVVSCYRSNPTTPLNCWREVAQFKASVAEVEKACPVRRAKLTLA